MLFERILVVIDGSQTSEFAIGASLTLSREDGSPITFCVTVDPELTTDAGLAAFGEMAVGRCRRLLDDALTRARAAGLSGATGVVVTNDPVSGVVALAREQGAGLIALGVAPRVGFLRPFMRNLAHGILRETVVPLCVSAPPRGRKAFAQGPRADRRRCALEGRHRLRPDACRNFTSTLYFCTLNDDSATQAASQALVDRARTYAEENGVAAAAVLLPAQPGVSQPSTIAQNAFLLGCDAIVMATHMREGFQWLVRGSVTDAVINSSNVPVVVVRAPIL